MRKKGRNLAHFILLILLTAFLLLSANIVVFMGFFSRWKEDIPFNSRTIMESLTVDGDGYHLSEEAKAALARHDHFAMILSPEGHILWQERLPKALEREYTLQDVASFTRYYLNDYPVHTHIIPEGLLVVGGQKHTTWKYTLEFNEEMLRQLVRQMPVILLVNIILLISVPLFIQRRWLGRREAERTEWIAGVSHDIRTPLTLILGNADAIRRNPHDPAAIQRADVIRGQGLKIRALIANLNTSSKLDFGMGDYKKTRINVCRLVRKAAADFLNGDPAGKYRFSLSVPEDMQNVTVFANEALFQRMLENIIGNAIRHNPDGCEISIRLEAGKSRPSRCVLQISDNGRGASAEALKSLNRGSLQKSDRLGEHGIGLRLVKQIAKYHAWRVTFSGNAPRGFCVRVTFNTSLK